MLRKFCAVVVCVLSCVAASAATINVGPAGSGAAYTTIQSGINAANTGDTVVVAPGTYYENLSIQSKSITLKSTQGASQTIIDGGKQNVVIQINQTVDLNTVVDGFTIQNGATGLSPSAGGITVYGFATIQNNTVQANFGQSISIAGGANVLNNHILPIGPGGPGSYCYVYALPGITLDSYDIPNMTIPRSILRGNLIEGDGTECSGEGISVDATNPVLIENNIIHGAESGIGISDGNRIDTQVHVIVNQNLVYANRYNGLYFDYFFFVGSTPYGEGPVTMIAANNTFVGNTTANQLYIDNGSTPSAEISLDDSYSRMALYNNLVIGNSTINSVVDCYEPGGEGLDRTPPWFDHNDFFNVKSSSSPLFVNGCSYDTTPFPGIDGNISVDPQFVSSSDFHLQSSSSAIDGGNNSAVGIATTDFDGNPRIQDAKGAGYPVIDMGIYETSGAQEITHSNLGLTASAYVLNAGDPLTLTATLAQNTTPISGPILFLQDDVALSTVNATAAGSATLTINPLPGVHRYTATYPGTGNISPSISTVIFVYVAPYGDYLTVSSSLNPSILSQSVTFTAQVNTSSVSNGTPTGSIAFSFQSASGSTTTLGTQPVDATGKASISSASLPLGNNIVRATYTSLNYYESGSAGLTQQVLSGYQTTIAVNSSHNPSSYGANVTFTAQVTSSATGQGTPAGSILFTYGSIVLGTEPMDATGTASVSTSSLPLGYDTITATYQPSNLFAASSMILSQQVISGYPTTTTINSSLNPSTVGQLVTFSSHVASANGVPTGSVSFADGGTVLQSVSVDASGNAVYATSALTANVTHIITASYVPTGTFAASSATVNQVVNGVPTTSSLTANPTSVNAGMPVVLVASVVPTSGTGVPTGTVSFYAGATLLGTAPLAGSTASLSVATLPAGADVVTCKYSGDATYAASVCGGVTVTIALAPTTLTITPSANPVAALMPVTFTAHLTINGQPAGAGYTVGFGLSGSLLPNQPPLVNATTDATGTATFIAVGFHTGLTGVMASFVATASLGGSSATVGETAYPDTTSMTLIAAPNPGIQNNPVTIVATVANTTGAGSPVGSVTFVDVTTGSALGIVTLSGAAGSLETATVTTSTLTPGVHTIQATYGPGSDFVAGPSATVSVTIAPQDFSLTAAPPSISMQTEHHGSMTLMLASIGGFSAPMSLTCGDELPEYLHCELPQTPVTLGANTSVPVTLTLDTDAVVDFKSSNEQRGLGSRGIVLAGLLPLMLLGVSRRKQMRGLMLMALLAAMATGLTACSGKYPGHTAVGTYTIPITATGVAQGSSSATTHTLDVTLVVTAE